MHGHSYFVIITVEGDVDPQTGWVMDFAAIDAVVAPIVRRLDHQVLNEIGGLENPTSEVLAAWFWHQLREQLPSLAEVSISETRSSRCSYRGT
jgi:6-pyruvoyltetrahydropterin/6-carboxytetrahydropterin synthase